VIKHWRFLEEEMVEMDGMDSVVPREWWDYQDLKEIQEVLAKMEWYV